ncbi:mannose-P-dolichol utilization defect 1 protein-like [Paramacrobiotus metropolitanus]|uniref:mannose-P-dolichol utilization defect 1 protein-like n=1 Tax=Paramacrobiotus metropolitanus TaxID=2943436 RepID=UPI00244659F7|nr:mannose-P-dolichol utilization defect 1 protein-like [Paramacrobiotus metropolitanus]
MDPKAASSGGPVQLARQYVRDYLLPERCVEEFFDKLNFLDVDCLKILISKGLGYGIVVGSSVVKVPQIMKLLGSKSGAGISLTSVFLEMFALTTTLVYSVHYQFPFSAWGESLFLMLETALIAILVLLYRGKSAAALIYTVIQISITALLLSGLVPEKLLKVMQSFQIVLVLMSKLLQIVENQKNKSTGQLSAVTVFLLFAGSVARVFTSIQETGDVLVILSYIVSSLANAVLCGQIVYFWNAPVKTKRGYQKKTQ